MTDPQRAPIFVTGTGRSGTSLLRSMLNAHPRIYLAQELAFHFWTRKMRRRPRTPSVRFEAFLRSYTFGWLGVEEDALRAAHPSVETEADLAAAYPTVLRLRAQQLGRPRWGEKNPLLTTDLDQIFAQFEDPKIIFMMRDPRANVASQLSMPWSSASLSVTCHLIRFQLKQALAYGDRILFIRLEDLLAEPEETMRQVLAFVDEPFHPAVLSHQDHLTPGDGMPLPWLIPADKQRRETRRPWQQTLSRQWIRLVESVNANQMARFDYPRAELEKEPVFGSKFCAVLQDLPEVYRFLWRAWQRERRWRGADWLTQSESLALVCATNPDAWAAHPDWEMPPLPGGDKSPTPEAAP